MTEAIVIELTHSELYLATTVATLRVAANRIKGREDGQGGKADWQTHCEGAAGECALAKHLNVFWAGSIGKIGARDVGGFEVKTTEHNRLCIRPDAPDDVPYVMMKGRAPRFLILGWMMGRDAKRPEWLEPGEGGLPVYYVPRKHLHPLSELPELK